MENQVGQQQVANPVAPQTTFEQSLGRLEEIVNLLGNGRAPLADSLALFEEGAGLLKHCNQELSQAEQKVETLLPRQEGGSL